MFSAVHNKLSGPAVFWLCSLVVQIPLLVIFLLSLHGNEPYYYIPVLLASVGYLTWAKFPPALRYPIGRLPLCLFGLSMLTLFVGSIFNTPWFASIAFLLFAISFLWTHRLGYLAVPLALIVRLPVGLDTRLTGELHSLTSRVSSYLLDLLFVPHLAIGNVVELATSKILVAEVSSGLLSVFAISAISLVVATWRRRPLSLVPAYLVMSVVLTVLCNTLRIACIAYGSSRLDIDLTEGTPFYVLETALLVFAFLMTLSIDAMLQVLFHPIGAEQAGDLNPFTAAWEWLFGDGKISPITAYGFDDASKAVSGPVYADRTALPKRTRLAIEGALIVGAFSFLPLLAHVFIKPSIANPDGLVLIDPKQEIFDGISEPVTFRFAEKLRDRKDADRGNHADQWKWSYGDLSGELVFSQPFRGWHELIPAFVKEGWILFDVKLLQPDETAKDRARIRVAALKRSDGLTGYLFMSGIAADGSILRPQSSDFVQAMFDRIRRMLMPVDTTKPFAGNCSMVHLWVENESELDDEQLVQLTNSFARARDILAEQIVNAKLEL